MCQMPARVCGTGRDVKVPGAGSRASCVGRKRRPRRHLQPGSGQRAAGTGQRQGRRARGAGDARENGRRAVARRREAAVGAGAGEKDAAGLPGKARAAPRPAVGPPPARARPSRCSNFTWPRGCGVRPAPAIPRGSRAARSRARKGPGPGSPGGRSSHSPVRGAAAGAGAALRAPWSRRAGMSGAPVPHYTARSGASDASGPATAAATPPPGGGPGGSGGGLSPGSANQGPLTRPLRHDWRAPRPMGRRQGRGASAPRGVGLR